jgi:hypothetical protein
VFVVDDEGDLRKSRYRFKKALIKAYERWNVNRLVSQEWCLRMMAKCWKISDWLVERLDLFHWILSPCKMWIWKFSKVASSHRSAILRTVSSTLHNSRSFTFSSENLKRKSFTA